MRWLVLALLLALLGFGLFFAHHYGTASYVTGRGYSRYVVYRLQGDLSDVNSVLLSLPSDLNIDRPFVFVDASGRVLPFEFNSSLPYWIEPGADGRPTMLWVRVPRIPARGTVLLYVKKAAGFAPDGSSVFEFFDDFSVNDLGSRWTVGGGSASISNGWLCVWRYGGSGYVYASIPPSERLVVLSSHRASLSDNEGSTDDYDVGFDLADRPSSPVYDVSVQYANDVTDIYIQEHENGNLVMSYKTPNLGSYQSVRLVGKVAFGDSSLVLDVNGTYNQHLVVSGYKPHLWKYISFGVWDGKQCIDWVAIAKYASQQPRVTVVDRGSYYEVAVYNPLFEDLNGFQVSVPASELGITSVSDSLYVALMSDANRAVVSLSPQAKEDGTVFLLYNGRSGLSFSPIVPLSPSVVPYTVSAPLDVNLYGGHAKFSVSPDDTSAGTKTITFTLFTESPYGIKHAECSLDYNRPVSGAPVHLESSSDSDTVEFNVSMNEEGVYLFNYSCSVFFTREINGSFTRTVIIPDSNVPSLEVEHNVPSSLPSEENLTVRVYVTSGGSPVQGVKCYVQQDGVYEGETNSGGVALIPARIHPGSLTLSCYKSGYHPAVVSLEIARASGGSGGVASGGSSGGFASGGPSPAPSSPPAAPHPSGTEHPVQPASPVGRLPVGAFTVLGLIVILAVLYFIIF